MAAKRNVIVNGVAEHGDTEGPTVLGSDGDIIWFAQDRLVVILPRTKSGGTEEVIQRVTERYEHIQEPLAFAVILTSDMERPTPDMEQRIKGVLDHIAPMTACVSFTILGSGFFASFFMSFLSRVLRLTRPGRVAQQLLFDLESTEQWIHTRLGDPDTSAEDILRTLRWATSSAKPSRVVSAGT